MEEQCPDNNNIPKFIVEYDFKQIKLDLVDKNAGMIKDKYKCLLYMITLPLSQPINPLSDPVQPIPLYNKTILKSTSSTDGWLNYDIVENNQTNIITIIDTTLFINKFSYNYDITANINKIGDDNVALRFMSLNPFTDPPRATNMNDLNLDETSFSNLKSGQKIKFTIQGMYQRFFINYPTTNFEIEIIIEKSKIPTPVYICGVGIKDNSCGKFRNNCKCFTIDGNGYVKIKKCDHYVNVPVYVTRITQSFITKYLYPEFNYIRDLLFEVTLDNSLIPPEITGVTKLPRIINMLEESVIFTATLRSDRWFKFTGAENALINFKDDQFEELNKTTTMAYEYSWGRVNNVYIGIVSGGLNLVGDGFPAVFFAIYAWENLIWKLLGPQIQLEPAGRPNEFEYQYNLPAGSMTNSSSSNWIAFGLYGGANGYVAGPNPFDIKAKLVPIRPI
jgi:hypothetical protein